MQQNKPKTPKASLQLQIAVAHRLARQLRARSYYDPNTAALIHFKKICRLFPEFQELFYEALKAIPLDLLPLYLQVPSFCLEVFEKRFRKVGDDSKTGI